MNSNESREDLNLRISIREVFGGGQDIPHLLLKNRTLPIRLLETLIDELDERIVPISV